jgi:hypothetical protein
MYPEETSKLEQMAREAREDLGDDLTNTTGKNTRPIGQLRL